jgi:hypothetical protein
VTPPLPPAWRDVWRRGIAPLLAREDLQALLEALRRDDPTLLQGRTLEPCYAPGMDDFPCQGGCLLAYAGWRGQGLRTLGEVDEYFARLCFSADAALNCPGAVSVLFEYFDRTPRAEMRRELEVEILMTLDREAGGSPC